MSMSKKDFIALADRLHGVDVPEAVIESLCAFMRGQNPAFKEDRWRDYLASKCRPSGGEIKPPAVPRSWPVQPLKSGESAKCRTTCGTCGRSWDDGKITGMTPAPAARCPFESFHREAR